MIYICVVQVWINHCENNLETVILIYMMHQTKLHFKTRMQTIVENKAKLTKPCILVNLKKSNLQNIEKKNLTTFCL